MGETGTARVSAGWTLSGVSAHSRARWLSKVLLVGPTLAVLLAWPTEPATAGRLAERARRAVESGKPERLEEDCLEALDAQSFEDRDDRGGCAEIMRALAEEDGELTFVELRSLSRDWPGTPVGDAAREEAAGRALANAGDEVEMLASVVRDWPETAGAAQALERAYRLAERPGTAAALEWFVEHFPGSPQAETATEQLPRLAFQEARVAATEKDWQAWMARWPEHPLAAQARLALLDLQVGVQAGVGSGAIELGEGADEALPGPILLLARGPSALARPTLELRIDDVAVAFDEGLHALLADAGLPEAILPAIEEPVWQAAGEGAWTTELPALSCSRERATYAVVVELPEKRWEFPFHPARTCGELGEGLRPDEAFLYRRQLLHFGVGVEEFQRTFPSFSTLREGAPGELAACELRAGHPDVCAHFHGGVLYELVATCSDPMANPTQDCGYFDEAPGLRAGLRAYQSTSADEHGWNWTERWMTRGPFYARDLLDQSAARLGGSSEFALVHLPQLEALRTFHPDLLRSFTPPPYTGPQIPAPAPPELATTGFPFVGTDLPAGPVLVLGGTGLPVAVEPTEMASPLAGREWTTTGDFEPDVGRSQVDATIVVTSSPYVVIEGSIDDGHKLIEEVTDLNRCGHRARVSRTPRGWVLLPTTDWTGGTLPDPFFTGLAWFQHSLEGGAYVGARTMSKSSVCGVREPVDVTWTASAPGRAPPWAAGLPAGRRVITLPERGVWALSPDLGSSIYLVRWVEPDGTAPSRVVGGK
jgi:hypothetical protein